MQPFLPRSFTLTHSAVADAVDFVQDGDWDLVNMQRLSKAVEDTAKDEQNAADDAATAAAASSPAQDITPDAPMETPTATSAAAATVDTAEQTGAEADAVLAEAIAAIDAASCGDLPVDAGEEETKSSDAAETEEAEQSVVAATKWHRELCSLAEMGFGDTARNVKLLEKHVTTSGGPGMER